MSEASGYQLTVPVVVRFRDGRLLKCHANKQFSVSIRAVQLINQGKVESVPLDDLKAVFFVRDLEGSGRGFEQNLETNQSPRAGRLLKVTFFDGETIRGRSLTHGLDGPGFFLYPLDPESNNERVFVVRQATREVVIENDDENA